MRLLRSPSARYSKVLEKPSPDVAVSNPNAFSALSRHPTIWRVAATQSNDIGFSPMYGAYDGAYDGSWNWSPGYYPTGVVIDIGPAP